MKLVKMKSTELLDLCIVLVVAAILSIFSMSIHTIGWLFSFFNAYTNLPLAEFLINVSFLSLMGLLWITYNRWRKAAKRQAELENIISSISPDVLLAVDSDRTIIECNDSLKRMFGYEVNEIINHKTDFLYFDWRSSESNSDDWHEISDMLERDGFHIGWATGKKKNGQTMPLEIITANLSSRGGAVQLLRDITERQRAEEALRESEEKYRDLFENANDLIQSVDENGKFVYVNKKWKQVMGYSDEEMKKLNLVDILLKDQVPHFMELFKRVVGGDTLDDVETVFVTKNGKKIFVSGSVSPRVKGGKFVATRGIFRDITERKWGDEKLRESEEKFRSLAEESPNMIFINKKGRVVYANEKCEEIMGYKREEFYSPDFDFFALIAPEFRELVKENFGRHLKDSEVDPLDYALVTKEGKRIEAILNTKLIRYGGKSAILGIVTDITERKRAEEKLKEYTRQIEEKNTELEAKNQELTATRARLVQREKLRALGQMASGVAHNFNNLLAIILGRVQLLQKKARNLDTEKGLRSIEAAALDASSTVKRIQDFARVRKDQEFKWVDIDELIEDVIALTKTKWKDQAEANGITIELEVQKDRRTLSPVAGDVSELREVFTNIIFNAVEAMPNGGRIVIRTQTDRKSVFVSFADSGIGIPDEVRARIFDPFFTTKGVKNMGLGLSVAYGIVQRHQGDFQIESKQGKGTTVIVRLPVSKTLGREGLEEKESTRPIVQRESANILVIDDEKGIRELLFDILTSANHMVKLTSGGAEGLKICNEEKFDIVFTDLGMPRMSGWEVAKAIKEIDSNITVCLITGWGVEMEEEKLRENGIDRVVTKPVKMEALLTLVSESIESKKKEKELVEEPLKCL